MRKIPCQRGWGAAPWGRSEVVRVMSGSDDESQASLGSSVVRGDTSLCLQSTGNTLWGEQGQRWGTSLGTGAERVVGREALRELRAGQGREAGPEQESRCSSASPWVWPSSLRAIIPGQGPFPPSTPCHHPASGPKSASSLGSVISPTRVSGKLVAQMLRP